LLQPGDAFKCGRYTTKTIGITPTSKSVLETQKFTKRCTVLYKPLGGCTKIKMVCGRFYLPNKDDFMCRRGDKMFVKSSSAKPKVYCNKNKPTKDFPASSNGALKVWVKKSFMTKYPNKGATCKFTCDS
jgi:hypothetical protein